jgi:hypothetical protein
MKMLELITEANVAAKITDPKMIKMIGIAMRHDATLPRAMIAQLGPRPTDQDLLKAWSQILDKALSNTMYGNISQDGKFDDWLTRLYTNGVIDYEEIDGEGGDALGAWKALSIRGKLKEQDQDFNRFKSLRQIQTVMQNRDYRSELQRIKDQAEIDRHKREKKEITILDDDRFLAVVPMNYGSCYTFNNAHGFQASFCTGSSSGMRWFERYSKDGPIISVYDKQNSDNVNGKWQIHAPTSQLNNGDQTISYSRGDRKFAELFPGLMTRIISGLKAHAQEITDSSTEIVRGGYNVDSAIADIKSHFPLSVASTPNTGTEPTAPQEI